MGYKLISETDTEVIVHLFDNELKMQTSGKNHLDAFISTISQLEGSWAIAAIVSGLDGILVSRSGAPMVIGRGRAISLCHRMSNHSLVPALKLRT